MHDFAVKKEVLAVQSFLDLPVEVSVRTCVSIGEVLLEVSDVIYFYMRQLLSSAVW